MRRTVFSAAIPRISMTIHLESTRDTYFDLRNQLNTRSSNRFRSTPSYVHKRLCESRLPRAVGTHGANDSAVWISHTITLIRRRCGAERSFRTRFNARLRAAASDQGAEPLRENRNIAPIQHIARFAVPFVQRPDHGPRVRQPAALSQWLHRLHGHGAPQRIVLPNRRGMITTVPSRHGYRIRNEPARLRERDPDRLPFVHVQAATTQPQVVMYSGDIPGQPRQFRTPRPTGLIGGPHLSANGRQRTESNRPVIVVSTVDQKALLILRRSFPASTRSADGSRQTGSLRRRRGSTAAAPGPSRRLFGR